MVYAAPRGPSAIPATARSAQTLGLRMPAHAGRFALLLALVPPAAWADALKPDQWSGKQLSEFVRGFQYLGDASRTCRVSANAARKPPIPVSATTCEVHRENGQPTTRVRTVRFEAQGLTWQGLPIAVIEYQQTSSITEGMVYHAAITYTFAASYSDLARPVLAKWRREQLQPERNPTAGGYFTTRDAITQSVRQRGGQSMFVSEFFE
jgi:hypothetical protein